ncbi:54S ribosomal protein L10, mitochondrial [Zancudomyces culisetae]|uniref:54S ribosomal protein L10, mitochondrial n=1 Tax=Zancudomyces culisetae TaxID=1213189 RepID=A0A1R1PUW1_ZANCU|nr:54S ribosomal protein L10, mitochondrial [Zancudomyces culisetae]|eukprot:OMH84682.1 54S ribosomal protein L10, mitochondrial [Zancudomyces culisetae]
MLLTKSRFVVNNGGKYISARCLAILSKNQTQVPQIQSLLKQLAFAKQQHIRKYSTVLNGTVGRSMLAEPKIVVALNTINDLPGSKKKKKRLGRGPGSGKGKTSGKGHKGQNSRTGNRKMTPGFEGGQTPIHKRYPKRGFKNALFKRELEPLNIDKLQHFIDNGRIDPKKPITLKELFDCKIVRFSTRTMGSGCGVSLLAGGSERFKSVVDIHVTKASKAAIARIEELGGKVTCVYHNRLALKALLKPEKFIAIPKFAEPTNAKLRSWYANPENRGYLSKL